MTPLSANARRLAGFCLFALLLAVAWMGAAAFVAPAPSFYGTARAPYSDALSWLFGALGFYFYGESHNVLLLRPSIAVVFSSILTLAGDIAAIPKLFAGLYAAGLAAAFALTGPRGRLALIALGGVLWQAQDLLIQPLSPDSQNTDFPAFAFTVAGLLPVAEVLAGRRVGTAGVGALAAGYLMLGFAAAIRGPMLLAGPVLLLLTLGWGLWNERADGGRRWWRPVRATAACAAAFVLPVVGDTLLRAGLGLDAPGPIAFYSFYSDPTHTLTNEAYFRYVELKPSGLEVMRDYLAFILSGEGRRVVLDGLLERLAGDGGTLGATGFPYVLAAAAAVGFGWRIVQKEGTGREEGAGDGPSRSPALAGTTLIGLAVKLALAGIALAGAAGRLPPACMALLLLGISLGWAASAGRPAVAAFALVYAVGLLFVVLTGTKQYPRIVHSYVFALYAAPLWAALDQPPVVWDRGRRIAAGGVAALAAAAMLVLTTATYLVPTAMKTAYRAEAMGRSAAIKISDDPGLDRSLYFSGRREMLYTRRDDLPVGTVRRYKSFDNPNGPIGVPEEIEGLRAHNALFKAPGAFVD